MAETEWLGSNDPDHVLFWDHPQYSQRRLLLFAVACCRTAHLQFNDHRSWAAVEAVEAFADNNMTLDELQLIALEAEEAWRDITLRQTQDH